MITAGNSETIIGSFAFENILGRPIKIIDRGNETRDKQLVDKAGIIRMIRNMDYLTFLVEIDNKLYCLYFDEFKFID